MRRLSLPNLATPLTLLVGLSLLSACAGHQPQLSARQQASRYAAHAPRNYTPPGPAWDPWGPYVAQAASRFNVPPAWIRDVMAVESGGQEYLHGEPITSPAGAMGLMQVMPQTYQALESEYGLGNDPYDPHDNILAGAAYIREMYDLFGSPGFLAAYNCGPACYESYLARRRGLPTETRHYVAMLAPQIRGTYPNAPAPAIQYAANSAPRPLPAAPRRQPARRPIRVAQLPQPPHPVPPQPVRVAALPPPPKPPGGFHLISQAVADTRPPVRSTSVHGHWAIQVGAFDQIASARVAVDRARRQAPHPLSAAWPMVQSVHEAHGMLYRARLVGLSRGAAEQACEELQRLRHACFLVSPAVQS